MSFSSKKFMDSSAPSPPSSPSHHCLVSDENKILQPKKDPLFSFLNPLSEYFLNPLSEPSVDSYAFIQSHRPLTGSSVSKTSGSSVITDEPETRKIKEKIGNPAKSITPQVKKYDVCLSFRGDDADSNFTRHLYEALCQRKIKTFMDDGTRRDKFPRSQKNAITRAKTSIIIFSKGYASSRRCLEELVKIYECMKMSRQVGVAVFYHVDPSDVRNQTGTFGNGFGKLIKRYKKSLDLLQRWRSAFEVANMSSGWYIDGSHSTRLEYLQIEEIVKDVLKIKNNIASPPPASSSSSPSLVTPEVKYDVYLSFSGKETRYNFTSHLYAALCRNQIKTFIDDDLHSGAEISPSILNVIKESKISVIIFSECYASSSWCLEEVVKISECMNMYGQIVVPVFYKLEPSHVIKQIGTFGEAFAKHEERFKDRVEIWRTALKEVCNRSNFDVNYRCESDYIEEIVKFILMKLKDIYPSDERALVEAQSIIQRIKYFLQHSRSKDVCVVGIWGTSGVGKTTYAKTVFDEIRSEFEDSYFALNVREESESCNGLTPLRQELLFEILKDQHSNRGFTSIKQSLAHKKVLIVFDDVTSFEQIEILIGDLNHLGSGSRIIITTRDEQLLENYGVDNIYEVKALPHREALQHFSLYAFQQSCPTLDFDDLSNMIVKYAKGVLLVLEVLGSFLRGKRKKVWLSTINKLETISPCNIYEVLKVSYDGLDNDEKNIFLDIACFLKSENRDFVIKFLDVSGSYAGIGISVLIEKCLITASNNKISMHDLLQEMGRKIVWEESFEDPGRRSRLWLHVDIFNVLKKNTGTKAIEGICLDMSKVRDIHLNPQAFARMQNLRFLKLYNSNYEEGNINKVHVPQGLESVFTKLRYLCWHGCPLKSLQSNFHPENLVALDMPHSNVKQLWTGVKHLDNLKHINLSHSKHLVEIPDLSLAPNLESLILEGSTSLNEVSSSVGHLNKLVILNLRHCKSLKRLPSNICKLKSLEYFYLSECSEFHKLPDNLGNLEALKVLEAKILGISEVPSSIVYLYSLMELNLTDCCIMELPNDLSQLSSLESLILGGNNFKSIPASIIDLSKLSYLDLGYCVMLQFLPELPRSLESIDAQGCTSLESSSGLSILSATNGRSVRVNFSNCFNLDQDTIKNSVEDALWKIPHMTMEHNSRPCASICFPGTEVSQRFKYQCSGSCINLDLPPGWFSDDFVTFALCAVVEFRNYHDEGQGLVVGYRCKFRSNNDTLVFYCGTLRGWYSNIGFHYVDSDHLFLGYDLKMYTKNFSIDNLSIQFFVEDLNTKRIDCCEVRKCGVSLVYRGKTRNRAIVEEEDEPRPKRFKRWKIF